MTCARGRMLLLSGVSTLALSIGAAEVRAADFGPLLKTPPPSEDVVTMWVQGSAFWTGGDPMRALAASSSFLGLPTAYGLTPGAGWEGAAGLDYHFAGSPWHLSADVRYGAAKAGSRSFFASSVNSFFSSAGDKFDEHESHLVADFMVGRDVGFGLGPAQVKFGVRVADLQAAMRQNYFYFYAGPGFPSCPGGRCASAFTTDWRSSFVGAGPRGAIEGSVPLGGRWAVDYEGGVAGLFGQQTLNYSSYGAYSFIYPPCPTCIPIPAQSTSHTPVFNADVSAALSYALTHHFKVSAGFWFDGYWDALRTLAPSDTYPCAGCGPMLFTNVDRLYYGPFLRLTGQF